MVPLATFVIGTGVLVVLGFTAVMFPVGILQGAHPDALMGAIYGGAVAAYPAASSTPIASRGVARYRNLTWPSTSRCHTTAPAGSTS